MSEAQDPGLYAEFGAYLRQKRKAAKKTWGQVRIQVGVEKSTISRDENGEIDIPPERLHKYAEIYSVPPAELLGKWFKVKYGLDPFVSERARPVSEKDLYPDDQVPFHQMLDFILNRGDKEQRDGIISNLKAFRDQVTSRTGETIEAYIRSKKAREDDCDEEKRKPA